MEGDKDNQEGQHEGGQVYRGGGGERTVLVVLGGHGGEGKGRVSASASARQLPGSFRRPAPAATSSSCRLPLLLLLLPVAERVEEAAQLLGGGHCRGGATWGQPEGGAARGAVVRGVTQPKRARKAFPPPHWAVGLTLPVVLHHSGWFRPRSPQRCPVRP